MEYKLCTKCNHVFEKSDKYFNVRNDGKLGRCLKCQSEYVEFKKRMNKDYRDGVRDVVKRGEKAKESARNNAQKRLARKKDLKRDFTLLEWYEVLKVFQKKCAYCGIEESRLDQEHFIPLTKQGKYTKSNIIPSCRKCNSSKNNNYFNQWYPTYKFYDKEREIKILNYINSVNEQIVKNSLN